MLNHRGAFTWSLAGSEMKAGKLFSHFTFMNKSRAAVSQTASGWLSMDVTKLSSLGKCCETNNQ